MKKSKTLLSVILVAIFISIFAVLGGCSANSGAPVSVVGIEQSDGGKCIVTYSDGTTSEIYIGGENGKNGADGKDVTVDDLFAAFKAQDGNENKTFNEFLSEYLTFSADTASVINDCLRSAVSIYTEFVETTSGFFGQQSGVAISSGSGVVLDVADNYAYIATNYHVVYDTKADTTKNGGTKFARKIVCYLYGSESYPSQVDRDGNGKADTDENGYYIYDYDEKYALSAELVGGSAEADIAVLRVNRSDIDKIGGSVKAAEFADYYRVGQKAIAIGNPESEGISVTEGIVSVDNENIVLSVDGTKRYHRSMRIDTAIYHGSSGGGLFNGDGKLIGITNAGNEDDQNINYAIPLGVVKGTVENILHYAQNGDLPVKAQKVTLGVTVGADNAKYEYDAASGFGKVTETVTVKEITAGSPAEKLGLKVGDEITAISVSGKIYEINRNFDISDALLTARKTDAISITYTRGGESFTTNNLPLLGETFTEIA